MLPRNPILRKVKSVTDRRDRLDPAKSIHVVVTGHRQTKPRSKADRSGPPRARSFIDPAIRGSRRSKSGLISQPLGGQGSSQQIGSDADDLTPRSQMLRGGIPRGVNHGDRLAAPGSEKPAIHQSKARLPNSQFQRLEPARQAASPRHEPTGLRGARGGTVKQAPIMSSGD